MSKDAPVLTASHPRPESAEPTPGGHSLDNTRPPQSSPPTRIALKQHMRRNEFEAKWHGREVQRLISSGKYSADLAIATSQAERNWRDMGEDTKNALWLEMSMKDHDAVDERTSQPAPPPSPRSVMNMPSKVRSGLSVAEKGVMAPPKDLPASNSKIVDHVPEQASGAILPNGERGGVRSSGTAGIVRAPGTRQSTIRATNTTLNSGIAPIANLYLPTDSEESQESSGTTADDRASSQVSTAAKPAAGKTPEDSNIRDMIALVPRKDDEASPFVEKPGEPAVEHPDRVERGRQTGQAVVADDGQSQDSVRSTSDHNVANVRQPWA